MVSHIIVIFTQLHSSLMTMISTVVGKLTKLINTVTVCRRNYAIDMQSVCPKKVKLLWVHRTADRLTSNSHLIQTNTKLWGPNTKERDGVKWGKLKKISLTNAPATLEKLQQLQMIHLSVLGVEKRQLECEGKWNV